MRLGLLALLFGGVAVAQSPPPSEYRAKMLLIGEIADSDLLQIKVGRLALDRSQDPAVRDLARRMIDEHSEDYQQLKLIADREGLPFPVEEAGNAKVLCDDLSHLSGAAFDRAYVAAATFGDDDLAARIERAPSTARDPALEDFIAQRLPVIRRQAAQAHRELQRM